MANNLKLVLSESALSDLNSIMNYIANHLCNPTAALNFSDKLYHSLINACSFPESCPLTNNEYVNDKTLRRLIVDNYIAFYKVDTQNNQLIVIRILYGMQNFKDIL
jgi:addiction module RelE/StbE family toxin